MQTSLAPLKNWLESKKATQAELPFLNLLKTEIQTNILVQVVNHFKQLRPSYSEGVKILELATEIILMDQAHGLFDHGESVTSWLNHLTQLRYPMMTLRDAQLKEQMLALPWPYGSKIKFERRGDRAGVEMKIFITSEADLIKTLASLERVKQELPS